MYDEYHHGYWLKKIEEEGVECVEERLAKTNTAATKAIERALNIYYRKQQDEASKKNLNIGKNTRFAAWIAAIAAVLTLLVTCKTMQG